MAAPVIAGLLLLGMAPGAGAVSNLGDTVAAWPASFRTYLMADGSLIADTNADQNPGNLDLGSGPSGSSQTVYYATDGTTAFFRVRMANDLADATKGGLVGGAFLVQLYQGTTLRAVVGIDGKSPSADVVYVSDAPGAPSPTSTPTHGQVPRPRCAPWTQVTGPGSTSSTSRFRSPASSPPRTGP